RLWRHLPRGHRAGAQGGRLRLRGPERRQPADVHDAELANLLVRAEDGGDAGRHCQAGQYGRHLRLARTGRRKRGRKAMSGIPELVPGNMALGMTERLKPIHEKVARMIRDEIIPLDAEFLAEIGKDGDRWSFTPRQTEILEGLKTKARERGL